ncbi:MAG TPA: nucleotidyl transferase AbiEii/AbiGii toxin family protein [Thermoanaerobaculia bacterium]|jgi:predicted nucleotidyltransferase component of viral defense system
MSGDKLTALQWRILAVLAGIEPGWTLTGGAALAGFYLKHRTTKDLDLFWHGQSQLGDLPREVRDRLESAGLEATVLQSGGSFFQLRVREGDFVCVVDLVADPVPPVVAPQRIDLLSGEPITVDDPQEILVNKLCALLGRAEIRDLVDVKELLSSGADLRNALAEAPRKDAGFSHLTLAWVLKDVRPKPLARLAGLNETEAQDLDDFKERLVLELLEAGSPE